MTRKRILTPTFDESDMKEMVRAQSKEIVELGASAWLEKRLGNYEGKCKGFDELTSAEYPKAPFEDQMRAENNAAALKLICKAPSEDNDNNGSPIAKDVHFMGDKFDDSTLSAGFTVEKVKCVAFLQALDELIDVAGDGMGAFNYGAKAPLKGGFASGPLYIVNQPDHRFRALEQSNSVFSMRNEVIGKLSKNCIPFKELKDDILRKVAALGYDTSMKAGEDASTDEATTKIKVSLQRMDVLLNWTRNSHYLMHQDSIDGAGLCYLTVIVNITPYKSTMLVAGAEKEVQFDSIGKGAAFPGSFWHRSGETRRGTIKLGLFFKQGNLAASVKGSDTRKLPLPDMKGEGGAPGGSADIP